MKTFRTILYFSLLLTSAIILLGRPYLVEQIRMENITPGWIIAGPILFGILFLIYIFDEINRKKSGSTKPELPMRSFIFGLLILVFLLPSSLREYKTRQAAPINTLEFFKELLESKDARVRTLVMMSTTNQLKSKEQWAELIEIGLSDPDPMVQSAATIALEQRIGIQLGVGHSVEEMKIILNDWKNLL